MIQKHMQSIMYVQRSTSERLAGYLDITGGITAFFPLFGVPNTNSVSLGRRPRGQPGMPQSNIFHHHIESCLIVICL